MKTEEEIKAELATFENDVRETSNIKGGYKLALRWVLE